MNRWNRTKRWIVGLACAGIPLVTIGSCDPATGWLDFYRDDDLDYFEGYYYYDDPYYYDDYYYYTDYYYDPYYYDGYYYDDCFFCSP